MRNSRKLFLILAMILPLICASPTYAMEQTITADNDTIQIAIPIFSSDVGNEEYLAYVGYTKEYLHEISQYTGLQYEIVKVPGTYEKGLQSALDMLRTGAVDLVAPVRYITEIGDDISFSQNSYATVKHIIQVPNCVYDGIELQNKIRVAVLKENGLQNAANDFFARNNITAQYIECKNADEQIQMVYSGKADVMLNSDLEHIPNTSVIAELPPQNLYFAATDKALLKELDQALIHIKQANSSFSQDLYNKYVTDSSQSLTLEEKVFIEQSEPYAVAIIDGHAPYQYVDQKTGEYRGIAVDLLNYISQKTGLQFEFIAVNSWDEALQCIEEGKVQIIAEMPYDYDFAAERNLTITRSYALSPYVLIAKEAFPGPSSDQRLALVDINAYSDGYYIGNVIRYSTTEECIEAIRSGEADYTYVDLYTVQYYLDADYHRFGFTPQSYEPHSVCFGIAKPTPYELLSILNKSINQLSATDMQNIITPNVNPPRDITIIDVILAHPLQSLVLIGAVGLLMACLLIFLLWRKEKISQALRMKAMEDGLTHLYNATACRKLVTHKLAEMKPTQSGAFLIMDMDNFKEINDQFGHHARDVVLQSFAAMLRNTLQGDEIIARIGGDEFVIYLESIKQEENLLSICDRICTQARSICIGEHHITISIGAVVSQAKDDYDTLYKLADKALYESKHNRKDRFHFAQRED